MLGPSLEDLFKFCSNRLSLKTVLMLGIQMIEILEFIHSQNILHRDLKPANFVMGNTKETERNVYILDFGLSCQFKNE